MSLNLFGIALTVVFGCILVGLIVELGYLLWRKKRRTCIGNDYGACWKTPSTMNPRSVSVATNQENISSIDEPDLELGIKVSNDMVLKTLGEEGLDSELMRLHNLAGPPRFLYTIKEETREDLESEDRSRKGSSTRSFSDIIITNPMPCSPLKSSLDNIDSYNHHGFNPLFEFEPPPKFKFLRDAEEKLQRRLIEEAQRKAQKNLDPLAETEVKDSPNSIRGTEERDKSLLRFMNNKEKEGIELQQHVPKFPSSTAQVLPLASSPSATSRP